MRREWYLFAMPGEMSESGFFAVKEVSWQWQEKES